MEATFGDGLAAASEAAAMPAISVPGARLIIRKMVLENFKSYGGIKTIGPFHKSFSAVVGPNGSGKSNVIDAMLFVFGKRANKLRQAKLSDLIHRSATYPDLEHTSVAVHFCEVMDPTAAEEAGVRGESLEDGSVQVPDTAFVVERRAFRNNSCKYYFNGKAVSQREVTDMLKTRGIDLDHNRFLILQGEVEQISLMKPRGATEHETGLLEYLEDIIGSNKYVPAIDEAFKDVEVLNKEREEKLSRVRVADKGRQELSQAREDAVLLLRAEWDMRSAKARMFQAKAAKAAEKLTQAEEKLKGFEERRKTEQSRLQGAEDALGELKAAAVAAGEQFTAADEACKALEAQFSELEKRDIQVREARKHAKTQIKKLEGVVTKESEKKADAERILEDVEESKESLSAAVSEAEERVATADGEVKAALEDLRGATGGLRSELNDRQAALAPFAEKRALASARVSKIEATISMLKDSLTSATVEVGRLSEELEACQSELRTSSAAASKAEKERDAVRERLDRARAEAEAIKAREGEASRRISHARSILEDGKAAMERAKGQSEMLQRLIDATKSRGELDGVRLFGRLGDLGWVDPSLDIAMSTACGALDWLVVESTEDGQNCVAFLRKYNLGRAKFLILDKQEDAAKAMRAEVRIPSSAKRLFDLVEVVDERFRPAFFFALRNTLVADNIDVAASVAYQGGKAVWRVVTLAGELIDTSGTMSGGGGRPRRGMIRTSPVASSSSSSRHAASYSDASVVSASDLKAAEKDLAEASALITSLREEGIAAAREIRALETQLRTLETCARKYRASADSLTERVADLTSRVERAGRDAEEAAARSAGAKKDIAAAEKELVGAKKELDAIAKEASGLEAAVAELEGRIQEAGGSRLDAAKTEAKAASKALAEAKKALTKAGVDAKGAQSTISKAITAIAEAKDTIESLQAQMSDATKQKEAIETEAASIATSKMQADEAFKTAQEELAESEKQVEASEKNLRRMKQVLLDIDEAMGDVAKASKELSRAHKDLEKHIETLHRQHARAIEGVPLDEEDAPRKPSSSSSSSSSSEGEVEGAGEAKMDEVVDEEDAEEQGLGYLKALKELTPEELPSAQESELEAAAAVAEEAVRRHRSGVNVGAIAEYLTKHREYLERAAELDEVNSRREAARKGWDALRKKRLEEFMAGFRAITLKLKEMYRMITLGGDAELELVDSLDPFSEGILFTVRPPKKSWKRMANLSGGEKTLSSLALVFALHHFKPTPLYVMDEIDAALDYKNVSVVAHYLKQRTDMAQFIIISLRNNMFELADRLVGIYKTHDVTKSVTIDPKLFAAKAGVQTGAEEAEEAIASSKHTKDTAATPPVLGERTNA
jgi:structural maintenance of chromosome 4